jgi:hypothetical protein
MASILRSAAEQGRRAEGDGGVGVVRQVLEMAGLRTGPGKLTAEDYYRMRVYRKDVPYRAKRSYVSQEAIVVPRRWGILADDKLLCYQLLSSLGIRVPQLHAICHPVRAQRGLPALRDAEEVIEHLQSHQPFPFVSKPVSGIFSKDVEIVEALEAEGPAVRLADGSRVPLHEFAQTCVRRHNGTIFQELLEPHPRIIEWFGPRICSLRLVVLVDGSGVRLFRAIWKIASGGNMADNYWRKGNMLARLNPAKGVIERCVTGLGPDYRVLELHPESGVAFAGLSVPDYDEAVELTRWAARALVGMPVQAWDIALTSDGPIPLEVNEVGSLFFPQIADERGLLDDDTFRSFVDPWNRRI